MVTTKVGRWNQLQKVESLIQAPQQTMRGYDITFPNAVFDGGINTSMLTFKNGNRTKNRIKVGGIRFQAKIETCYSVPITMHFMVVQNKRPEPTQTWDGLKSDFWISNLGETSDNTVDFVNNLILWDYNMAFSKISQNKMTILMHLKKTMHPQVNAYGETSVGTQVPPITTTTTGAINDNYNSNVWNIDRYLQMNKMMEFEQHAATKPYYPIHVLMWCQPTQSAAFSDAATNNLFCANQLNTIFWNE